MTKVEALLRALVHLHPLLPSSATMHEQRDIVIDDTQTVTFWAVITTQDFSVHGHSKITMSAGSRVGDMLEEARNEIGDFNLEDLEVYRIRQPVPLSSHLGGYLAKVEDDSSPSSEQDANTHTLESQMLDVLMDNLRSRGMDGDLVEKVDRRDSMGNYFQSLPIASFQAILLCPAPQRHGESRLRCSVVSQKLTATRARGNKRSHESSSDRASPSKKPKVLPRKFMPYLHLF